MITNAAIDKWAYETFGASKPTAIHARAGMELAELAERVFNFDTQGVMDETVDLWVLAAQLAHKFQLPEFTPEDFGVVKYEFVETALQHVMMSYAVLAHALATDGEVEGALEVYLLDIVSLWRTNGAGQEMMGPAVDAKMSKNRSRRWGRTSDGSFQHVE